MRQGTTLVELVVSLAILGLTAGIAGFAIQSLKPRDESTTMQAISRARGEALELGRPVRLMVDSLGAAEPHVMLFLPDGRVMGNTTAGSQ